MKTINRILLVLIAFVLGWWAIDVYGADTKLTALSQLAQADDDDLWYIVDDANGTPASYKIPREEALISWAGSTNITTLGTVTTGTINHEAGGLEADVSAYGGIVGINGGSTLDVDTLAELLTAMTDVTKFFTDDDIVGPSADPDVDASGELGIDTDGANEPNDVVLRTADTGGDEQYCLAQAQKTISFTLLDAENIDAAALIPIWPNETGMTFTIREWKAWSNADNVTLTLKEITDETDFTALTTVDAVEIATDGTSVYYGSDTTITHATIEHDHILAVTVDTGDASDYITIVIKGTLNADVD